MMHSIEVRHTRLKTKKAHSLTGPGSNTSNVIQIEVIFMAINNISPCEIMERHTLSDNIFNKLLVNALFTLTETR